MSNWTESFKNHPIHKTLNSVTNMLRSIKKKDYKESEILESIHRLELITNYLSITLKKLDPLMVSFPTLDDISSIFVQLQDDLARFSSSKNLVDLETANNRLDNLLQYISNLIIPRDKLDIEGISDSISSFRESMQQHLMSAKKESANLNAKIQESQSKVDEMNQIINTQKSRLDQAISNFQTQFSDAEAKRSEQFNQLVIERNQEYAEAKEKRNDEFSSAMEGFKTQHDTIFKEAIEHRKKTDSQLERQTRDSIAEIEKHKEDAQKLVNIISMTGMAGGYQKVANKERRAAKWWKGFAASALIGLVALGVSVFIITLTEDKIEWPQLAGRIFAATTLGIFAVYAARQAERSDEEERRARKMELELASINSYLADLQPEIQEQIKTKLAEKFFGREDVEKLIKKSKVPKNNLDVVKYFVEELLKLKIGKT